jgi:hypothetical protein
VKFRVYQRDQRTPTVSIEIVEFPNWVASEPDETENETRPQSQDSFGFLDP